MKFLVDAQLPRRLVNEINALGGDAIHTLDLSGGNRTSDSTVIAQAAADGRVVVTKDRDFVDSFLLRGEPAMLLFVATGNVSNTELIQLFRAHWPNLLSFFRQGNWVELSRTTLTLHT